ncbi:Histone-lysine N-methyltransferase ash1 [Cytospora mali]|uniref:Histone-lysine N-methyltransferase ash1 n=1 Tax=Cytospora mali TaxID=578113 RepID=A0A194V2A3_CYTMA|nr:Histone-lysine N-methyltransferase ash1 [Valsa mali var. pyri (nom. inval.)]
MANPKPHWQQPSHPDIQEVIFNEEDSTYKSLSRVAVAPFGVYANLIIPPCTIEERPTYATCQIGRDQHISLNSDLLYMNHSCEPSLIIDVDNLQILAGPKGLRPGDELTFFYPSTEWEMAQPFDCSCGTPSCHGQISGAKDMTSSQLEGYWLSGHIRELKKDQKEQDEKDSQSSTSNTTTLSPPSPPPEHPDRPILRASISLDAKDPTVQALQEALDHAEKVVDAARTALVSYMDVSRSVAEEDDGKGDRVKHRGTFGQGGGSLRRAADAK